MARVPVSGWFVWHELVTPNAAGAHEFYGKTLGWEQQPWENDSSYVMFKAKSGPVGATVESKSATPNWLPYISTRDVDSTIEAAGRLGGRVETPATSLPNGGRYAVLADPQGATFGIHAAGDTDSGAPPSDFSWHELATSVAPGIAFGFYGALFDWDEISEHDMGPMGMYLVFGRNGRQLGGMFDKGAAGKPGAAYWLGYVSVADLEGTVERAKAARGSLLMGPMDVPGGDRVAQLMDPYGAFFALHKAAAETGAAKAAASGEAAAGDSSAAPAKRKPAKAPKAAKKAARPAAKKPLQSKPAGKKKRTVKKAPAKRAKPAARKKAAKRAAKKAPARRPVKARPKGKKKAKKRGR